MSGKMVGQAALTFRLAHQTDVDFSIDVPPFLSLSKRSNQLLKLLGMLGSVLKPLGLSSTKPLFQAFPNFYDDFQ